MWYSDNGPNSHSSSKFRSSTLCLMLAWFVGMLDCWFVGLLDCWIVGLLGNLAIEERFHEQVESGRQPVVFIIREGRECCSED